MASLLAALTPLVGCAGGIAASGSGEGGLVEMTIAHCCPGWNILEEESSVLGVGSYGVQSKAVGSQ